MPHYYLGLRDEDDRAVEELELRKPLKSGASGRGIEFKEAAKQQPSGSLARETLRRARQAEGVAWPDPDSGR